MNGIEFCKASRNQCDYRHWGMSDQLFWRTAGNELYATDKTISEWTGASADTIQRWRKWAVEAGMLVWSGLVST